MSCFTYFLKFTRWIPTQKSFFCVPFVLLNFNHPPKPDTPVSNKIGEGREGSEGGNEIRRYSLLNPEYHDCFRFQFFFRGEYNPSEVNNRGWALNDPIIIPVINSWKGAKVERSWLRYTPVRNGACIIHVVCLSGVYRLFGRLNISRYQIKELSKFLTTLPKWIILVNSSKKVYHEINYLSVHYLLFAELWL